MVRREEWEGVGKEEGSDKIIDKTHTDIGITNRLYQLKRYNRVYNFKFRGS